MENEAHVLGRHCPVQHKQFYVRYRSRVPHIVNAHDYQTSGIPYCSACGQVLSPLYRKDF
jgi:hypothetical protein